MAGMANSPFSASDEVAGNSASSTIALPEPFTPEPLVENVVEPAPMPEVKPVVAPTVSIPEKRRSRPLRRAQRRSVLKRTPLPDDNLREIVGKQEAAKQETVNQEPSKQEASSRGMSDRERSGSHPPR